MGGEVARPPLLASQGADGVSLGTLPLDQVVIEDTPVSHHHLGESVREGDPVPERDVVFHNRRLAVLARHDQRPRMRRHGLGARGGDIQDVNRLLHDRAARNLDEGPVFHQRGVEGRKCILLEVGVPRKMPLQQGAIRGHGLRQALHSDSLREAGKRRERRRVPAVHEHHAGRGEPRERERLEGADVHLAGRHVGRAECRLGDGAQVGETPVFVPGGRKTERGKPIHRLPAHRQEPILTGGFRPGFNLRELVEIPRDRLSLAAHCLCRRHDCSPSSG